MSRKRRHAPTTVFIACEGRNTEPAYFGGLREAIDEGEERNVALTVYPDEHDTHKSDPMGLIGEARSRADEFDELWVVFDKNGYTRHAAAFAEAKKDIKGKKVNIAFSSISFEQWVLLHYTRSTTPYLRSAALIEDSLTGGPCYFMGYAKKPDINLFGTLQPLTRQAIRHAAWLWHSQASDDKPIYEQNPYTDVDRLVARLLGIEDTWFFGAADQEVVMEQLGLALKVERRDAEGLDLIVKNNRRIAFTTAQLSWRVDLPGHSDDFEQLQAEVIDPDQTQTIRLSVPFSSSTTYLLIKLGNNYVEIELS